MKKPVCCKKTSLKSKNLEKLKTFLNTISDKNRLRILCSLKNSEKCVCEIYENLELSQNLTSHHLKILEKENLVFFRKEGVKVFYKLNEKELVKKMKMLNNFLKI